MSVDTLSATFAALADPTRRAILARLTAGQTSVTELAEPFRMSMPAVTKHLKVLENAGLIVRGRDAQWRPCALRAQPLQAASQWLDAYRQHWEQRLDRLEDYLNKLQAQHDKHGHAKHGSLHADVDERTKRRALQKPAARRKTTKPIRRAHAKALR